jgi:hypothetical protein
LFRYIEYIESWNSTVQSAAFKGQVAHNEEAVRQAKRKKGKAKPKKKTLTRVRDHTCAMLAAGAPPPLGRRHTIAH